MKESSVNLLAQCAYAVLSAAMFVETDVIKELSDKEKKLDAVQHYSNLIYCADNIADVLHDENPELKELIKNIKDAVASL